MANPQTDGEWVRRDLGSRLTFYHAPTAKFTTCTLRLCLHVPLARETVTATALVPHVLGRGCRGYPDLTAIGQRLEELYGAGLSVGVVKIGEVQSLFLSLDVVDERLLAGARDLFSQAVDLLARVCLDPSLDGGNLFPEDVVAQEKENLANRIRGLQNDKARWAAVRCVEEMCPHEPYALHAEGRLEDLAALGPEGVTARWRTLLAASAVQAFAVGGGPELDELLARALEPLRAGEAQLPITAPGQAPATPRVVHEEDDVQQPRVCMGYRTGITRRDQRHPAMNMYTGILGGFPHSKLFREVREKESLAYDAGAEWDGAKGVLLVEVGTAPGAVERVREVVERQVAELAAGRITDDELEFTRRALLHRVRATADSPYGMLNTALGQALADDLCSEAKRMARLAAVTRADVTEVAQTVALDTVFVLEAPGGGRR